MEKRRGRETEKLANQWLSETFTDDSGFLELHR